MSGFGSASAFAHRAESSEFYSLMHDRNGFDLENSEAGASHCQCKRRWNGWMERKYHKWPKIVKGKTKETKWQLKTIELK